MCNYKKYKNKKTTFLQINMKVTLFKQDRQSIYFTIKIKLFNIINEYLTIQHEKMFKLFLLSDSEGYGGLDADEFVKSDTVMNQLIPFLL